jgi:hypothetical protein
LFEARGRAVGVDFDSDEARVPTNTIAEPP